MRYNDEVLGREMAKPGDMLRGSAVGTVAELKARSGRDLGIIGRASLVQGLRAAALIDRYTLMICPLRQLTTGNPGIGEYVPTD
jgi:hypothetical protein